MLTMFGKRTPMCDRQSRRRVFSIGGLALGGLALPQFLRAEGNAGVNGHGKGIIMIFLPGGPPAPGYVGPQDRRPAEIRGEFKPIATNVPGIEICEMFPRIASMADTHDVHPLHRRRHGRPLRLPVPDRARRAPTSRPAVGPPSARCCQAFTGREIPRFPPTSACRPRWGTCRGPIMVSPASSGVAHAPFTPHGEGKDDMVLKGITLDRLQRPQAGAGVARPLPPRCRCKRT